MSISKIQGLEIEPRVLEDGSLAIPAAYLSACPRLRQQLSLALIPRPDDGPAEALVVAQLGIAFQECTRRYMAEYLGQMMQDDAEKVLDAHRPG